MKGIRKNTHASGELFMIGIVFVVIVLAVIGFTCTTIVPAGHVGVIDTLGNVDDYELKAGFHFKNPLSGVYDMSIKTQEYTMTYVKGEGAKHGSDVISALTKEGLSVDLDMTILYKLTPEKASDIYQTIGKDYVNVIVRPQVRTIIREIVSGYEAKQLYSVDGRQAVALEISDKLGPELSVRGVILESVLIRHIQLPRQLTQAIEDKLTAEQAIEKRQFEVQIEEQEALRRVIEAQGIADAQTIIDESLTPAYLQWYWIENLNTHNSVIYVPINPQGMIDLGSMG